MNPWWTDQQAGLFGGIGGGVGGLLGGIYGTLAGICAPRGKCKGLVVGISVLMIGTGLISLIAGLVALSLQQPYGVYYPLLLVGIVCPFVFGASLPAVLQRYREADNRRLEAEELRRS